MIYYELSIKTDDIEILTTKLIENDLDTFVVNDDDPRNNYVTLYFEEEQAAIDVANSFAADETSIRCVDDTEWKEKYKEDFHTIKLTDSITVVPSWESAPSDAVHVIDLDPGMAFGTGAHQTTAMCVQLLEKANPKGKDVIDIGTGSGILSIAAAKLGATHVDAIDIDIDAVDVACENIKNNHLEEIISISEGDLTNGLKGQFDIALANIIAEVIIVLVGPLKIHLRKDATLIVSGILNEKKDAVIRELSRCGYHIFEEIDDGEWCALGATLE